MDDPSAYCPTGSQLKAWLFGGASIPTKAALFDLATYESEIVSDLFGADSYFASAEAFWTAQNAAVVERAEAYRAQGWSEVVVLGPSEHFATWEHERTPKRKGGKVFISVSQRGDVEFHEGYLTQKEARRLERGETLEKPVRPELTAPLQNYIDLHRHAAVRASLSSQPKIALRLMLAHVIVGSTLFRVTPEPQRALTEAITESVESCASEAAFDKRRRRVLDLLGFDPEAPAIIGGYAGDHGLAGVFARLLELPDRAVFQLIAPIMAEALEQGTAFIELLGIHLGVDMAQDWQADDALLDLIKDREVLDCIVADVAGDQVAQANASATGKVKRRIVRDCLHGENGRTKVDGWVPRWMAFPPAAYTARGAVGTVVRAAEVTPLVPRAEGDPERLPEAA